MATATEAAPRLMTAEEFLALPDDGTERMLIRGRLWEKPMTRRNRWHSKTEARIAQLLANWVDSQPEPRGEIYSGEAGFRLPSPADTIFGIDVAYVSPEMAHEDPGDTTLMVGPPLLAVEILSPNDKQEEIAAKIDSYLAAGVPLVWIVDPHFRTVTLHRPDARPDMFSGDDELIGDPHLPGFRIATSRIFAR